MPKNNNITIKGYVYKSKQNSTASTDLDVAVITEFEDGHSSSDIIPVRLEASLHREWHAGGLRGKIITVKGFIRLARVGDHISGVVVFAESICIEE